MTTKSPLNLQVLEEAAAWFIEFRGEKLVGHARDEFLEWLRRSPEHIRAYLEVSETYVRLPTREGVPTSETERLLADVDSRIKESVVALNDSYSHSMPVSGPTGVVGGISDRASAWRIASIAASLLLFLGGTLAAYFWTQRGLYITGPGEERTVTLADASRIELNARTRVRVAFTSRAREIQLLEGQALFQVAKDKARPFIVHSGVAIVRAVGTEFDVYRKDSGTTVTVLEGRVAVYASAHPKPESPVSTSTSEGNTKVQQLLAGASTGHTPRSGSDESSTDRARDSALTDSSGATAIFLSAGEQLKVTADQIVRPHAPNIAAATAWTRGQLEFEETPLSEVAEEFNRASTRRLVIEDPKLRELRISGVYESVDPTSLVLFFRDQGLRVTERDGEIRVTAPTEVPHRY